MITKIEIAKEQLVKKDRTRDKASTLFAKLYAKLRGKCKGWNSLGDERLITSKLK